MVPHSSILAWKIPWAEDSGGLQSMGLQSWTQLSIVWDIRGISEPNFRRQFGLLRSGKLSLHSVSQPFSLALWCRLASLLLYIDFSLFLLPKNIGLCSMDCSCFDALYSYFMPNTFFVENLISPAWVRLSIMTISWDQGPGHVVLKVSFAQAEEWADYMKTRNCMTGKLMTIFPNTYCILY